MALKKTKTDVSQAVDTLVESVAEDIITTGEIEAIQKEEQKKFDNSASMQRLQLATAIISEKFGLDDEYSVIKFNDKGKIVELALENSQFIISVTIKNSEMQGMTIQE